MFCDYDGEKLLSALPRLEKAPLSNNHLPKNPKLKWAPRALIRINTEGIFTEEKLGVNQNALRIGQSVKLTFFTMETIYNASKYAPRKCLLLNLDQDCKLLNWGTFSVPYVEGISISLTPAKLRIGNEKEKKYFVCSLL